MSWSISKTGTPDEITATMDQYAATLGGLSKAEFDTARPHLEALVAQNRVSSGRCVLDVVAWGSVTLDFSTDPPTETSSSCYCRITAAPVGPAPAGA